jgi:hypothetical protein
MIWNPMKDVPETYFFENIYVDLLVRAERIGALFRIPNCFIYEREWWSIFYKYPLRDVGWRPVAWMPIPAIPSEDELAHLFSPEGAIV